MLNSSSKDDLKDGAWSLEDLKFCGPIPPHTPHGVSFSLPKWDDLVQLMEENMEVASKIDYGYPRVFIHDFIKKVTRQVSAF